MDELTCPDMVCSKRRELLHLDLQISRIGRTNRHAPLRLPDSQHLGDSKTRGEESRFRSKQGTGTAMEKSYDFEIRDQGLTKPTDILRRLQTPNRISLRTWTARWSLSLSCRRIARSFEGALIMI